MGTPRYYFNRPFYESKTWTFPKSPYNDDAFIRLILVNLYDYPLLPKASRDYAYGRLLSPLVIGKKYKLSLAHTNGQFNLYGGKIFGHDGFGVLIGTRQPKQKSEHSKLEIKPQFRTPYLFQDSTWRIMEFEFVADSAYKYITLGNFWDDSEIKYMNINIVTDNIGLFIDDIKIEPIADIPKLPAPITICKPDSVYIQNKEKKDVEWWINGEYYGWAVGLTHYCTEAINQVIVKYYNDYDTTYVFIKSKPEVLLKQEGFLCPWLDNKGFVSFSSADSLSSYYWQLTNEKVYEPKLKLIKPGNVLFIYSSPKQCEWQQDLETKDTCPEISNCFFPNSFSPNNDGLNETYKIECENVIEFEIRIFNRWGEQIFYSKNPLEEWDGTYKDAKCPIGIYMTSIKVTYPSEKGFFKTETKRISLNLIR